jgi:hypothetical protein
MVRLNAAPKPVWAVEVKWSDRFPSRPSEISSLVAFCSANGLTQAWATSRTIRSTVTAGGISLNFIPTSELCFTVGYNIIHGKRQAGSESF